MAGVTHVRHHAAELPGWSYNVIADTVQVDGSIIPSVSIEELCSTLHWDHHPIGKIPLSESSIRFAAWSLVCDTLECLRVINPPYLRDENFTFIGISCTIQPEVDP